MKIVLIEIENVLFWIEYWYLGLGKLTIKSGLDVNSVLKKFMNLYIYIMNYF